MRIVYPREKNVSELLKQQMLSVLMKEVLLSCPHVQIRFRGQTKAGCSLICWRATTCWTDPSSMKLIPSRWSSTSISCRSLTWYVDDESLRCGQASPFQHVRFLISWIFCGYFFSPAGWKEPDFNNQRFPANGKTCLHDWWIMFYCWVLVWIVVFLGKCIFKKENSIQCLHNANVMEPRYTLLTSSKHLFKMECLPFPQSWNDYKLAWDASEYGGLEDVRLPNHLVWKPDVLLYNR